MQSEKGATSTVLKGEVQGYQYVDYLVGAGAGQTLNVRLATSNASSYFNINPPDGDVSMFIGSTSGGNFEGVLPTDGDYAASASIYAQRRAPQRVGQVHPDHRSYRQAAGSHAGWNETRSFPARGSMRRPPSGAYPWPAPRSRNVRPASCVVAPTVRPRSSFGPGRSRAD